MRVIGLIAAFAIGFTAVGQEGKPAGAPSSPVANSPSGTPSAAASEEATSSQASSGGLEPIPENAGAGRMYSKLYELTPEELRKRAEVREYAKQLKVIRRNHFGMMKAEKVRAAGIAQLAEFTDAAAFGPMIEVFAAEKDDVRLAMLDHFAKNGAEGQAALAWVVIYDKDTAIRNEALRRMTAPVDQPVLYLVDRALRSSNVNVANAGAVLANGLNITQAIPLMIFAQVNATGPNQPRGDLAWIAIQTQRAYVAGLQPVAGNGAGAFQPIIGILNEGAVLRIIDAVVVEYRTVVHYSLVNMTTNAMNESTEAMGYDINAWRNWYNDVYLPGKQNASSENQKPTS